MIIINTKSLRSLNGEFIKYQILVLISVLSIISNAYSSTSLDVKGVGFPNQESFSRLLKSKYDLIQNSWDYIEDDTYKLNGIFFDKNYSKIPHEFKYNGVKKDYLLKKEHIKYVNWGVPLLFTAYGAIFWDWGTVNGFKTRNEGWFGKNTYAGGTDKFAHMYSHFLINRMSYSFYRNNGISHKDALKNSFILASTVGVLIEVGDGVSHYGFSFQDLISDFVGIAFGHLLNSDPYLDELIGFQFWWWNNSKDSQHKGHKFNDPVDDYNNQKYIFNVRFAAIPMLREFKATRYINLDIGYYSRGYKDQGSSTIETRREIFTGFSLNISQLLRDYFPNSGFAYHSSNFFRYYQPPYTGLEASSWEDRD